PCTTLFRSDPGHRAGQDRRAASAPRGTRRRRRIRPRRGLLRRRCPMTVIGIETKRKLREMGASALLEAIDAQDEGQGRGMSYEDRIQLVVDEAHSTFTHGTVEGVNR